LQNGNEKLAKITDRVNGCIARVRTCNSGRALSTILRNAQENKEITQEQKNLIKAEIENRLPNLLREQRAIFSRQHPRPEYPRAMLEKLFDEAKRRFDLSDNEHGNHVRVGGDMIKGEKYLDLYISYKSPNKWVAGLAWVQETALSQLLIRVDTYHKGRASNPDTHIVKDFNLENEAEAIDLFLKLLSDIDRCNARKNEQ
jgi:hypothetical protein